MTTLQTAMKINKRMPISAQRTKRKRKIADELLGKYKGAVPSGKTSTQYIKRLRESRDHD